MSRSNIAELIIGDLVAKIPIIQGGMGIGISLAGLASAVANQGGIGVITGSLNGMLEPDLYKNYVEANNRGLIAEIKKARTMTKGILGVNIMVASATFVETVKTAIKAEIDIIFAGAGLALNLPEFLNGSTKTKLVPIVSSARAAGILIRKWLSNFNYTADAIVVEGPKAGGHLGFKREQIDDEAFSLERLIPEVIDEINSIKELKGRKIPVIAAGGIYSGADIYNIMKLGASGVQMGTRFVTTHECDASIDFKQTYIDAKEEDITIIASPVGLPGRAIRNEFIDKVNEGKKQPYKCPYHCVKSCDYKNTPYCINLALVNARKGNFKHGFAFAGANVYKTDKIISVGELFEILLDEFESESNFNSKL